MNEYFRPKYSEQNAPVGRPARKSFGSLTAVALFTFLATSSSSVVSADTGSPEDIASAWQALTAQSTDDSGRINALEFIAQQNVSLNGIDMSCLAMGGVSNNGECTSVPSFVGLNLSGLNVQLEEAVFSNVDLTNADFTGANLSGADFSDALLEFASFRDANLEDVILSDSTIYVLDVTGSYGSTSAERLEGAHVVHAYVVTEDHNYPIPAYLDGVTQSFLRCSREWEDERFDHFWDAACSIGYPQNGYVAD